MVEFLKISSLKYGFWRSSPSLVSVQKGAAYKSHKKIKKNGLNILIIFKSTTKKLLSASAPACTYSHVFITLLDHFNSSTFSLSFLLLANRFTDEQNIKWAFSISTSSYTNLQAISLSQINMKQKLPAPSHTISASPRQHLCWK